MFWYWFVCCYFLNKDIDCRFEEFNNINIIINKIRCNEVINYMCVSGYELIFGNLNWVCGIGW